MAIVALLFFSWLLLMPLDARRFHWSRPFPMGLEAIGGALLLPAGFLMSRALADNPFASAMVRIQGERRQRVVSTGVYGVVRHPMYLGAIGMLLGAPLLLGSSLGLAIGVAAMAALGTRILGEERLLDAGLEGYADYRKKVRYRLIPYVW